jgi:8-oxo-dGTP pyrophosphatase MutT (NUDIX family)
MSCPASSSFTIDNSLSPWNVPAQQWLVSHGKDAEYDGLATANVVFNSEDKVLLIQRASSDSMPNKWELPGGAVDDDDLTILHGAARELAEESGLVAKRFTHVVTEGPDHEPGQAFPNSTRTKVWCRFTFHVEVVACNAVTLDPKEHQDFAWVSEQEVRERKMGNRELAITRDSMAGLILEAFRLRKQRAASL